MRVENHVAIITGASRGIGAACAKTLAREGAHVVLVDLLPSEETIKEITEINPNAKTLSFEVDIKDKEVIQSLVKDTYQAFGRIDILVNNAGTASRMDLEEMTEEVWDRDIDTNLKGTFTLHKLSFIHI